MGQTNRENLRDVIRKLGGTPKGTTTSALIDEVEQLIGAGGGVTPEQLETAVEEYMTANRGELSDSDLDDIFAD